MSYFNPRSPHGERPYKWAAALLAGISIHAPRTGSDDCQVVRQGPLTLFQSTLPARGATHPHCGAVGTGVISIHAPRTGSDMPLADLLGQMTVFQSTLPARGATHGGKQLVREGLHFNPRSPHGERRLAGCPCRQHPAISIHAPRTGSDWAARQRREVKRNISIHAPRTGSDGQAGAADAAGHPISIHAPRTGSDCMSNGVNIASEDFNPRSPHGERRFRSHP